MSLATLVLAGGCSRGGNPPQLVIGVATTATTATAAEGATVVAPGSTLPPDPGPLVDLSKPARPEPRRVPGLKAPNGSAYGTPLVFRSSTPVPDDLLFALVVGSDARPNEDVRRTNGDSVHILAVNPRSGQGTIVGIPRDAWVEVPGKGNRKLSTVLQSGPETMAATIRHLTGLPTKYYVLTGFVGLPRIVDDLGGVDVYVDRRMNDPYSGARFERGWHHFDGKEALAFSRNRHDTAHGDFSRSENHGTLILAALAKLRAEVTDDEGLRRWIGVLTRNVYLDMPMAEVHRMGSVAARLDPKQVRNVVTPGRVGTANGQSVVFLGEEAARIFNDLRGDAVLGSAGPATTTTTEAPTTTTTSTPSTVPPLFGTSTTSTTEPGDQPPGSTTTTTKTTEPGDGP